MTQSFPTFCLCLTRRCGFVFNQNYDKIVHTHTEGCESWLKLSIISTLHTAEECDYLINLIDKGKLKSKTQVSIITLLIEDVRAYHKSLGFEQWHSDYPMQQTVLDDIVQNVGYAFVTKDGVIGYCCIIFGDEPAYHEINGASPTQRNLRNG